MTTLEIAQRVDAKGLSCPMPIVKTAQAMKTLISGQLLEVLATDAGFDEGLRGVGQDDGQPARRVRLGRRRLPFRPPEEVGAAP